MPSESASESDAPNSDADRPQMLREAYELLDDGDVILADMLDSVIGLYEDKDEPGESSEGTQANCYCDGNCERFAENRMV